MLSQSLGRYPGIRRRVYDVFDMATAAVDGGPDFRLEKDDMPCGLGGLRGLGVRDGRLIYPGPRAAPTSDRAWTAPDPVAGDEQTP